MNKLQTLSITGLLLFGINTGSFADFNEGHLAYQQGEYQTALKIWQPLAEQGDARAQYNLGSMYINGLGVLKDDKRAIKWYRKATDQGLAEAQNNLGVMYGNGQGVSKDDKKAVEWYRKAAEQSFAEAQYNLGVAYANGLGVLTDLSQAKYWINQAYENPNISTKTEQLTKEIWSDYELWTY
jgi:TPR repeat protein